ncbi:uncharacterized protein LOC141848762 [Brevipalpus obovatus]|uniref:uncharacterized protein LOC141848762 n=1 Tax=Brevipalpus obovatus TaxID=246614 RepID=UPI003D9E2540
MKILITTQIDGVGHVINLARFGVILKRRRHEVIFAHRKFYRSIVEKCSLDFLELDENAFGEVGPKIHTELINLVGKYSFLQPVRAIESLLNDGFFEPSFLSFFVPKAVLMSDTALREALQKVPNYDLLVIDQSNFKLPVLLEENIPHVDIYPSNPLVLHERGFPWGGFSENTSSESSKVFKQMLDKVMKAISGSIKHFYLKSDGECGHQFHLKPKYLGFYHYPESLDYHNLKPALDNYERIDSLVIDADDGNGFCFPEKLQDKPGKLIFFSIGTIASGCGDTMNDILEVLAASPNRFIVTMGGNTTSDYQPDKYDNLWLCDFVDQLAVLKQVDLIIFHGGNNTMMEALYFGVPMIIVPQFLDQLDNAQRVEDKKIGRRMFRWEFDAAKLLDMIEDVLLDEQIHKNVAEMSSSMRSSRSADRAVDLIEEFHSKLCDNGQVKKSSL